MIDENFIVGKWIGIYEQQVKLSDDQFVEVGFEVEFVLTENGFEGACMDYLEIEEGVKEKAKVVGFIDSERNMISFTKTYENYFWIDVETEEYVLEKGGFVPSIEYYGNYLEETQQFEGVWEIVLESDQIKEGEFEEWIESGRWLMKRA